MTFLLFFAVIYSNPLGYPSMPKPDIHRLLEFQKLLAQFNEVDRRLHRKRDGKYQQENDSEHSYNLVMSAWYVSSFFPHLDQNLILRYALVHDFVEVFAGDTYIFASAEELASKSDREKVALDRLKEEWNDFADLTRYAHEYEELANEEAKFVYALDKVMPMMTIYIHDGYTWATEGVTLAQLRNKKASQVEVSPEIKPYFDELCEVLLNAPELIPAE